MWVHHNLSRSLVAGLCALAVASASVPAAAMPLGHGPASAIAGSDGVNNLVTVDHRGKRYKRKFRKRRHVRNRRHNYRPYRRHRRYYRRHDDGIGLVLGLAGLGIGLAIANNYNQSYYTPSSRAYCPVPGTNAWHDFCLRKYRSYVPATGMYTRYSGQKAYCVCP